MAGSRITLLAVLLVAALFGQAAAQDTPAEPPGDTAEIRIGLPGGVDGFAVTLGEGALTVELPRNASYPLDFAAASSGLLRGAQVTPTGEDRVRLELQLAGGLLESVTYRTDSVTLRLRRRFAVSQVEDASYRLGPDDKLQVTIGGHPELSREVSVTRAGTISAPLVGDMQAAGLSVAELSASLSERLARDYLVDPQVDLQVTQYKSQWVMVGGEVRTPGRVALKGGTTLKDVLAEAGGLGAEAGEEIVISRQKPAGDRQTIPVSRRSFEMGETDPVLVHGDIVQVARAGYCYVNGEVKVPGRVRIEPGMTLLKAISLVGGMTDWANRKEVQVLPGDSNRPAAVYNLQKIESGRMPDPELVGGEIIIVKRRFL